MSVTENGPTATEDNKVTVEDNIYSDIITEIELGDENVDLMEDKNVNPENEPNLIQEPQTQSADVSTPSNTILPTDDTVSEFFTVDSKTEVFDNDIISEIDSEGIDFKNDTDVVECHHDYENKKLLFEEEDLVVEEVPVLEEEEENDIRLGEGDELEVNEPFEINADEESNVTNPKMPQCAVITCSNSHRKTKGASVRYHRFPSDAVTRAQWVRACGKASFNTATARVCSRHFSEHSYERDVQHELLGLPARSRLRKGAVPCMYIPGSHEEKIKRKEKDIRNKVAKDSAIAVLLAVGLMPAPGDRKNVFTGGVPLDLNRMHVMEDVEEGCNVSGALPSSPGHAEQRPDPPKEISTPTETPKPVTNGLPTEQPETNTPPPSPTNETKKDEEKPNETEDKKEIQVDNEESNSNDSEISNKRKCEEEDTPAKRLRTQVQQQFLDHDKVLTEYLESAGCNTAEDLQTQSEQLLAEIRTLNELAREKEREWNNILHLKKVKEELLLRMQRKRQVLLMNSDKDTEWDLSSDAQLAEMLEKNKDGLKSNLMMVPIVSSSPANSKLMQSKSHSKPRSILPKPYDYTNNECRQGRQGPILDVRSIIADYRQRHPETVPRRGRRLRSVLNNANHETVVTTSSKMGGGNVLNMSMMGGQVRHDVSELGLLLSTMDAAKDTSRPSSADSSAEASFKDILVQFARLSQSERQELQAQAAVAAAAQNQGKPYPEVTLHPVPQQTGRDGSLLHGILTKNQTKTDSNKPTTFSPTLARLLTAPERVSNNNAQAMYTAAAAALNSGVSINDLLTTNNKSRNEITITPIGMGQNTKKDGEPGDEEEAEDSADRLVIDEGGQEGPGSENRQRTGDANSEMGDEVPQCQGCHQKSAQFVCAGCGNQWYCSRDCQVAAWDEHSEVCSG